MKKILAVIIVILLCGGAIAQTESTKKYSLITDLGDSSVTVRSIRMLFDSLDVYSVSQVNKDKILKNKGGLVIILLKQEKVKRIKKLVKKYTRSGGTTVMDIRSFAALNGYSTKSIGLRDIIVTKESDITKGYKKGNPIRYSNMGKLIGLVNVKKNDRVTVLGESGNGEIALIEQKKGTGKIVAVDLISLQEPEYGLNTENKYFFLVNAIGNKVKYGTYFDKKYKYSEFVNMMKGLGEKYPSIITKEEGEAGGDKIYSLSIGKPSNPGILIYSNVHGNEWENSYGTFSFIKYIAEHKDQKIIDLDKYFLKVVPIINPYGHEHMTRQNKHLVDLNRNGDYKWDEYIGADPGNYKPGAYDWKGTGPFSEQESKIYKNIAESGNYLALLDLHGNPSGTGFNKWMGVAANTKPDAFEKGELFKEIFNNNIRGRYILKQKKEKKPKLIIIEKMRKSNSSPTLYNTISKNRYGYIVELLCGYGSTEFIVMQDDIVCELCEAFCKVFAPLNKTIKNEKQP